MNTAYVETWLGSGNRLDAETPTNLPASSLEPHYSVQVLAKYWRLDESIIRRIFESAPSVLRLGKESRRSGKREYFTLRIPASIADSACLICTSGAFTPTIVPIAKRGKAS